VLKEEERVPVSVVQKILLWGSQQSWLERQARRSKFARKSALRFTPGENIDAALGVVKKFHAAGITSMVHELGENVADPNLADEATEHYLKALDCVEEAGEDAQISLKLTHIGLDLGLDKAYRNLAKLTERAATKGNFVWIDMEASAYTDATLEIFRRASNEFGNVGVCLQSYLHRTSRDLEDLLDLGPTIRATKGAYKEAPSIAYQRKEEIDQGFFDLCERLLRKDAREAGAFLSAATHDDKLIAQLAQHAEAQGIAKDQYEIQMLYNIREPRQFELAESGYRVRIYVSYGVNWFPWLMRRLAERPANLLDMMKNVWQSPA
jgi:proline dehydrogenase